MSGGSTKTETTTQQLSPMAGTENALTGILQRLGGMAGNADLTGNENAAIGSIEANAKGGNPFAPALNGAASHLLSGGGANSNDAAIKSNLDEFRGLLTPYANGSMIGSNTGLKSHLDTIANDVQGRVNSMFAASGRDMSGMNQQTLARGISEGTAPVIAAQFNADTDRALGAASSLYGAGNQTYGLLNQNTQTANANRVTGAQMADTALAANDWGANRLLNVEAMKRGIPISNLTTLLGAISPVAAMFGKQNGTGTSTQEDDPLKTMLGAVIAGGTMAAKFSDRRLKTDIVEVGALFDGTPVYRYRYRGSPQRELGLMAQDVEKFAPTAVTEVGGMKLVDYLAATSRAAEAA